jgi:hypothetical protein
MSTNVVQYRITACCGSQGSTLTSFGTTGGTFQNGLHISTQDVQLDGGFIIEAGQCYTIIELSGGPIVNPVDYGIFINIELGNQEDCSSYDTTSCECPWLYTITPCCREFGDLGISAQQVNLALSNLNYEDGTYIYGGLETLPIPGTNLILEPGQCYTFTRLQDEPIQTTIELDFSTANWQQMNLELGCNDNRCQDCPEEGIAYLKYEPCCDSFDTIYVRTETFSGSQTIDPSGQISGSGPGNIGPIVNTAGYTGVFQFVATGAVSQLSAFVPGQCYTGTLHTLGSEAAPAPQDNGDYNDLPLAPYSTQLSKVGDCERPPCPECNPTVYALTNCDGITINTETDVSAYIGTYIELDSIPGCWFVQEYSAINDVKDPTVVISKPGKVAAAIQPINTLPGLQTQPVTVTGPCDGCDCKCYEVNGYTGSFTYINCEGKSIIVRSTGADKFCAATRPNIVGKEGIDYTLTIGEDCVNGECVDKCFLLTNCDPTAYPNQDATLNSTLQSLSQYVNTGEVVVLVGYDGCWTITEAVECDCPVDVTVIRDYTGCEECLGITAYKLSNCEKINEVVYTLQDFSAYVGQVIKDDCACWVVEEIDYQPPSETTIVDPIVFEDCTACLTTYYTLTDCDNSESVIISSTNLSVYVGQAVKIEGCDPCYEVALYEDTVAPALWEEVTVTEASATCFDCKQLVPRCSTVFNNSTEDRTFTYINANGDSEETEIVKSGHFSLRTCVQYWDEPDTFIYNYYGDCTVYEYDNTPLPGECNCIDVSIETSAGTTVYLAVHTGEFFNDVKVFDLIISGIEYKIWGNTIGGWGISTVVGTTQDEIGFIKTGILNCPVADNTVWQVSGGLPGGIVVLSISTLEGACATITVKEGHCVQYFPNNRKVRPGYNTPICSADKYDKITCNAADIMYKKVLELRYGISDCCPEENEKWLIKKELIELQALTDPNYTCDPLTDCCGQRLSSCSCNS